MYLTVGIIITGVLAALPESDSSCNSFASLAEPCGCTISKESFDPLCASDGATYLNECFLECEKMLTHSNIRVNHKGMCHTQSRCSCHARYEPVCATNGVTYSNDCVLKCNSQKDSSIRMRHKGECQGGGGARETRLISRSVLKTCTCNPSNGPMCATNGVTYPNYCVMRCDSDALNDKSIQFAHWGVCEQKKTQNGCQKKHNDCSKNRHDNRLSYTETPQKKFCDCPLNSIAYYFRCGGTPRDSCTCAAHEPKSQQLKNLCNNNDDHPLNYKDTQNSKIHCTCAAVHKPVCANNHVTYANMCVLHCYAKKDPNIRYAHAGNCPGSDPRLITRGYGDEWRDETLLRARHFRRADRQRNKHRRQLDNIKN